MSNNQRSKIKKKLQFWSFKYTQEGIGIKVENPVEMEETYGEG